MVEVLGMTHQQSHRDETKVDQTGSRTAMEESVSHAFAALPDEARAILLQVRERIMALSASKSDNTSGIGPVVETLKWGQPSYLTQTTKAGSTLRLGVTKHCRKPALFVHCQTDLAEQVRDLYGDRIDVPDKRHIILCDVSTQSVDMLDHIIALVLTYHLRKRSAAMANDTRDRVTHHLDATPLPSYKPD